MIKNIIGILFIVTSYFDAVKYIWQAKAIKKAKSAKGNSRKFLNVAVFNDLVRLIYSVCIGDIFIFCAASIAMITMCYCWYICYWYYPYRKRGLINFKRPNIILYLINSLLPNSIRRRL